MFTTAAGAYRNPPGPRGAASADRSPAPVPFETGEEKHLSFRLQVCGAGADFVDQVIGLISTAVTTNGLDDLVAVGRHEHGNSSPSVTLVAASATDCTPQLEHCVSNAVAADQPLIPVIDDTDNWSGRLPSALADMNAIGAQTAHAGSDILQAAGILVPLRGVFLSYRRTDGAAMALQLSEALGRLGVDTFLDVLDIKPTQRVQERILDALDRLACVVLLESPQAIGSRWVEEEIVYAERRRLGALSICWAPPPAPGGPPTRFGLFDNGTRVEVSGRLVGQAPRVELSELALADALEVILQEMTQALYFRRANLERELMAAAGNIERRAPWRFIVRKNRRSRLVGLSPYQPAPEDLYELALAKAEHQCNDAVLVHHPMQPDTPGAGLLQWLGAKGPEFAIDTDRLRGLTTGM
jgi:hypothetical protein